MTEEELLDGIQRRDRVSLGKAISLVESSLQSDRIMAVSILKKCFALKRTAKRVGITGIPGVGKSTFINAIGRKALDRGMSVAVLAIDPSSGSTGGSILGDKTRMSDLTRHENAFIRPSPARGFLGGTGRKTREALILLEAAGFDLILIETVGVGQSEVAVKSMVDIFVLLALPNSGDELQGIKRGIMEAADLFVINKVEHSNEVASRAALAAYRSTISLLPSKAHGLGPQVLPCSSLEGTGVDAAFEEILNFLSGIEESSYLDRLRKSQYSHWLDSQVKERLIESFSMSDSVMKEIENQKHLIESSHSDPITAAETVVSKFLARSLD